jgi:hypothetical protein
MNEILSTLAVVASALGYPNVSSTFLDATASACDGNETCAVDALIYAAHESAFNAHPQAWSWDARGHVSCGFWQTPCSALAPTLLGQARDWVKLRNVSLARYGSLLGLAGNTPAGEAVTRSREAERDDCLFAVAWSIH